MKLTKIKIIFLEKEKKHFNQKKKVFLNIAFLIKIRDTINVDKYNEEEI